MTTRKQVWVLAGGNGAGKSTFYFRYLKPFGVRFINADIIARQIDREKAETASYDAMRLAERLRSSLLNAGESFCYETVFSHPSKIDFLAEAIARGYEVILVYIHLFSVELNVARVAQRVSEGGHSVPEAKIESRLPRTLEHIRSALPLADITRLYDNSFHDQPFQLVAEIRYGTLTEFMTPLPDWAARLLSDYHD